MSSDGSSGISHCESNSSSSVCIQSIIRWELWGGISLPNVCIYLSVLVFCWMYLFIFTFAQVQQTGAVSFPLPSERFCEAEVRWTPATGRRTDKSEHLPSPCNPAFWHLKKHKVRTMRTDAVMRRLQRELHSVSHVPSEQEPGLSWWRAVWSSFWFCPPVLSGVDPFLGAAGKELPSLLLLSVWLRKPVGRSATCQSCCHASLSHRPHRTWVKPNRHLPHEAVAWGPRSHFDTFWAERRHLTPRSREGRSSSSLQCWQTNINRHIRRHQSAVMFLVFTTLWLQSRFSPDI